MQVFYKISLIIIFCIASLHAKEAVSLQLLWKHQFEFAGFYIAKEKGYYDDVGLDVTIKEYTFQTKIVNDVLTGKTDIGIGRSSLVLDKLKGKDIHLLNALYQSSPYVVLALQREDLHTISDFKNKKIMLSEDITSTAAISSMMKRENIQKNDYNEVAHSFDIKDLIDGEVDLMTAYLSNEPYELIENDINYKVFDPKKYGFDVYSDILFTSGNYLDAHEDRIQRFKKATLKAWKYAFSHELETIDLILNKYNSQHKTKAALLYEASVLKQLAYKDGIDFGDINKEKIKNIANIYRILGLSDASDIALKDLVYEESTLEKLIESILTFEFFLVFSSIIATLLTLGVYNQYILRKTNKDLSALVYEKTSELQKINDSLEDTIEQRTQELAKQNELMDFKAHHDSLTALPNRLLFLDRLEQSIKYAKRNETTLSILFLDLDRFKDINDTYGHEVGDKLLRVIAKKLLESVREVDTICRLGGDEFTIILKEASLENTSLVAQKIINRIEQEIVIGEHEIHTSFSIGISIYPHDGTQADILIRNADTAMYCAKDNGKNQYKFYNKTMTEIAIKRAEIEHDLRIAIIENQFEVYYQPKINAKDNTLSGMEALVRWNHPSQGFIAPNVFINIAEATGLISALDTLVMNLAVKQLMEWHKEGLHTGKLSLNLSMIQLEEQGYVENLKATMEVLGVDTKYIELEITENQIMQDSSKSIQVLKAIQSLGISISIDDFGTGYSSLAYLKKLPINTLKIDKSFVDDLPHEENDVSIVKAIVALAHSLGLNLIAEGVETKEQLDFLCEQNCTVIQGYYYSKPLSALDCREFLVKFS